MDYSDKKLRKLLKLIASAPDHAPIDCLWYQCDIYSIKAQSEMLLNEQDHASASKSGGFGVGILQINEQNESSLLPDASCQSKMLCAAFVSLLQS